MWIRSSTWRPRLIAFQGTHLVPVYWVECHATISGSDSRRAWNFKPMFPLISTLVQETDEKRKKKTTKTVLRPETDAVAPTGNSPTIPLLQHQPPLHVPAIPVTPTASLIRATSLALKLPLLATRNDSNAASASCPAANSRSRNSRKCSQNDVDDITSLYVLVSVADIGLDGRGGASVSSESGTGARFLGPRPLVGEAGVSSTRDGTGY